MSERTYQDGILPTRGRGAGLNPGNRFETTRLHINGEALDDAAREHPEGVQTRTTVIPDRTQSIINPVDSPDLPFRWTINPYRGCEHGCVYCYARPTHEALGFSCGLDFETKIVAKMDAPALLRRALMRRTWQGEPVVMSGVTDPYQPVERTHQITRGCLEIMASCGQPVSIVTKNALILRDLDLLTTLASSDAVHVAISLTTLDARLASKMEPRASAPRSRLEAIRTLSEAGVPTMVMTAPMIPGLNDVELPRMLEEAAHAGARSAGWVMLRLPHQVRALFLEWVERVFPERASKIEHRIRSVRDGTLNSTRFGTRMRGSGVYAQQIRTTFKVFCRRYGLDGGMPPLSSVAFRSPSKDGQLDLFQ